VAGACDDDALNLGDSDAALPQGGTGGSGGGGSGGGGSGGGDSGGSNSGGGGSAGSSGSAASGGGGSAGVDDDAGRGPRRDGGPSGPFDASVCALPDAPGSPPPDCVAPCMWEATKACRLSKCCVDDHSRFAFFSCDVNGLLLVSGREPGMLGRAFGSVYYPDGSVCYSYSTSFDRRSVEYSRGNAVFATVSAVAATTDGGNPNVQRVTCDGTSYLVDSTHPKCAPWNQGSCVSGVCPDAPPPGG
jgi:hypothetical protein